MTDLASRLMGYRDQIASLASEPLTPSLVMAVRRSVPSDLATLLVEIASIQAKAIAKFGPGVWLATDRAIQQASDRSVARYKASLLGERFVIDGCGGVGGDAIEFARRGSVVTIDRDPLMTAMAAANLAFASTAFEFAEARPPETREAYTGTVAAVCCDLESYLDHLPLSRRDVVLHLDPDRRPDNRRVSQPAQYEPSCDRIKSLIDRASSSIVKLAPAADLDDTLAVGGHRRWVSLAGRVREQMLIHGELLGESLGLAGQRSAVRVDRDGSFKAFSPRRSESATSDPTASRPDEWIFDPDPAVRASGLTSALAIERDLSCIGQASGFLTGARLPSQRCLLQCYHCRWIGPADVKVIRREVKVRQWEINAIKVRGTDHDPARLMREIFPNRRKTARNTPGVESGPSRHATMSGLTLLIGRVGQRAYAAIAQRYPVPQCDPNPVVPRDSAP